MPRLAALDNVRRSRPTATSYSREASAELVRRLAALIDRLEARERDATRHAREVATLSVAIARQLDLPGGDVRQIRLGALLHDVGKLVVPSGILTKPAQLSAGEWDLMREHPRAGVDVLAPLLRTSGVVDGASAAGVLAIVRSHHERWDGRGYPDGLRGADIPFGARIVAVADAFEAMLERRPYRPALSRADALAEVERESARQFDPLVVETLLAVL